MYFRISVNVIALDVGIRKAAYCKYTLVHADEAVGSRGLKSGAVSDLLFGSWKSSHGGTILTCLDLWQSSQGDVRSGTP
jgi:hypothetical protein